MFSGKTEPEALAIGGKFANISKKNIYPHHMGSSRYVGKFGDWKKKLSQPANLIRLKKLKKEPITGYWFGQT
jgi:hypothetical protein